VETATGGTVRVKIYFGGIAGDEVESWGRIKRNQLDATIASMLCHQLAPSMRVTRVPGLVLGREENAYVLGQLKPELDREFLQAGFVNLAEAGVGAPILFTRTPVASMADLRRLRLWTWDGDEPFNRYLSPIGMQPVGLPISEAGRAYDDGRVDGFMSVPTGALAFQWSAQARYMTDLHLSYLSACVLVSTRFFDELPNDARQQVRSRPLITGRVRRDGRRW
jgi:TRAP-type C4-dicarboxylate transport system substrate-binding protein